MSDNVNDSSTDRLKWSPTLKFFKLASCQNLDTFGGVVFRKQQRPCRLPFSPACFARRLSLRLPTALLVLPTMTACSQARHSRREGLAQFLGLPHLGHSFRVTWPEPFVWVRHRKSIDREGLGESRTGTRQVTNQETSFGGLTINTKHLLQPCGDSKEAVTSFLAIPLINLLNN